MTMISALGVAASLIAAPPAGPVPVQAQAHAQLLAVERRWNAAVAARDSATIAGLLTADFRFVAPDGSVHDRSAMLRMASDRDYAIEPFETQEVSVQVSGSLAMVTGCFRERGTFRTQPFEAIYRYIDMYRYERSGWMSFYAQANVVRAPGALCGARP